MASKKSKQAADAEKDVPFVDLTNEAEAVAKKEENERRKADLKARKELR